MVAMWRWCVWEGGCCVEVWLKEWQRQKLERSDIFFWVVHRFCLMFLGCLSCLCLIFLVLQIFVYLDLLLLFYFYFNLFMDFFLEHLILCFINFKIYLIYMKLWKLSKRCNQNFIFHYFMLSFFFLTFDYQNLIFGHQFFFFFL